MRRSTYKLLLLLALALVAYVAGPRILERTAAPASPAATAGARGAAAGTPSAPARSEVGFTSRRALDEHYAKHGGEFGAVSKDEYLRRAQTLRDAPAGGDVLEAVRDDGVITRFDLASGAFLAFHADKTIRTFFKPNDGRRYFERQLRTEH